jgi:transcriptional regulator with XRE-family HTH domain
MVNYMAGIKKRILRLRNREGMTQAEFAEVLGVCQQYVASMETGYRRPGLALVFMMATKFGVSEDWLKHGKGRLPEGAALAVN